MNHWCIGNGQIHQLYLQDMVGALNCLADQQKILTAEREREMSDCSITKSMTNEQLYVRRLTPLECERLQGFPDNWTLIGEPVDTVTTEWEDETYTETIYQYTDSTGKKRKASDSARYKALGNSIALPFWQWLARRICALYPRQVTVGSLFDGIGGFPLVFSRCGAKPVWASEIEEFCIAVTKEHFPETEKNTDSDYTKTYTVDMGGGKSNCGIYEDLSPTLATTHYGEPAIMTK